MVEHNRSVPADTVLPHFCYRDIPQAVAWLTRSFGFVEHYRYGDPVSGAQMYLGRAYIMLKAAQGPSLPAELGYGTQSLTIFVKDVCAHFATAKAAGARLFSQHANDVSPDEWGATVGTRPQDQTDRA
jgi:uncharacterized glyoxalase superfamily protein PhnB